MEMTAAKSRHHLFVVASTMLLALMLLQSSWTTTTTVDCKSIIPKYHYSRNCSGDSDGDDDD